MKKNFFLFLFFLFFVSGCAFGVRELKPDYPETIKMAIQPKEEKEGLVMTAEWLGNAPPLATSRNLFGRINRFVIPYTRSTNLIHLKLENKSDFLVYLNPQEIILQTFPDEKQYQPLPLDYFKKNWPVNIIPTQEIMIDQSYAIGEVIRTIFRERTLPPGENYEGILAFKRLPTDISSLRIKIKIKKGSEPMEKEIEFKKI